MATDLQATDLKGRIQQVEDWVKTLRWLVAIAAILLGVEIWFLIHPSLFQAGAVRARKFTVVDDDGKTLAELGTKNGVSYLSFYDANYKSKAQIVVSEAEGPKIILFDKDQNQRALLEVAENPELVLHSADHQVRALLTADDETSVFWLKDKKGFTTILGNAVEETRKVTKNGVQPVVSDTVKKTPGASIQLRDPGNSMLWKAP
jgi:ABC-type Na+ efflux pump permease subunit